MSLVEYKDKISNGDTVVIFVGHKCMHTIVARRNSVTQTKYGALRHSDLIGKLFGSKIVCSKGFVYALHPTPELWTLTLPHRTQILYSMDISMITMLLDLKPGSIVCEAGTGSGSLSHAILRTIAPNGFLHTYDFHKERVEKVAKEFQAHGFDGLVKAKCRDVYSDGFDVNAAVDAVFLDLPSPWNAISFAEKAIKIGGGRICSFSPCIEQVQKTCAVLQKNGFKNIKTMECLLRTYDVRTIHLPKMDIEETALESSYQAVSCSTGSTQDFTSGKLNKKSGSVNGNQKLESECFLACVSPMQTVGHTGLLTFASLPPRSYR